MNLGALGRNLVRGFQHDRENLADFAEPAPGEKADQVMLPFLVRSQGREILNHRMPDEDGAESRFVVELRLKRKYAEHQLQVARHLADSSPVPRPDLGADVVDDLQGRRFLLQSARQTQIESRIIDQHNGVRIDLRHFSKSALELLTEISIPLHHFPQPDDRGGIAPIDEAFAGDGPHFRPASSRESQFGTDLAQRSH